MNGQPRNAGGARKAVTLAQFPGVDDKDKQILHAILDWSQGFGGAGSKPTNKNFVRAAGVKDRAVRKRLEKMIGLGLIHRTKLGKWSGKRPGGKQHGEASEFAIDWSHEAFPDRSETREQLSDLSGVIDTQAAPLECHQVPQVAPPSVKAASQSCHQDTYQAASQSCHLNGVKVASQELPQGSSSFGGARPQHGSQKEKKVSLSKNERESGFFSSSKTGAKDAIPPKGPKTQPQPPGGAGAKAKAAPAPASTKLAGATEQDLLRYEQFEGILAKHDPGKLWLIPGISSPKRAAEFCKLLARDGPEMAAIVYLTWRNSHLRWASADVEHLSPAHMLSEYEHIKRKVEKNYEVYKADYIDKEQEE